MLQNGDEPRGPAKGGLTKRDVVVLSGAAVVGLSCGLAGFLFSLGTLRVSNSSAAARCERQRDDDFRAFDQLPTGSEQHGAAGGPAANATALEACPFDLSHLGPLLPLLGTWEGIGYNVISLPLYNPNDTEDTAGFQIKADNFTETLTFEAIGGNHLGDVFNRGYRGAVELDPTGQEDQVLRGVKYSGNKQHGLWMFNAQPGIRRDWTVARMQLVPHGVSLIAPGTHTARSGLEVQAELQRMLDAGEYSGVPQNLGSPGGAYGASYADSYVGDVQFPLRRLLQDMGGDVARMDAVQFSVAAAENVGNIGHLAEVKAQVEDTKFNSSFWIETWRDAGGKVTRVQLQYAQTVFLEFGASFEEGCRPDFKRPGCLIRWPHIQVSTFRKTKNFDCVPLPGSKSADLAGPTAPATTAAPAAAASEAPATTSQPAAFLTSTKAPEPDSCYDMTARLGVNDLQAYPENPDSGAFGFVSCTMCTVGNMSCTTLVYGGKTRLVASHVHRARSGDGETGSGSPVINFCGSPTAMDTGTPYLEDCPAYDSTGAAHAANVRGQIVTATTPGETQGSLVRDIASSPGKYYFNFHSEASSAHERALGLPPKGICRGQLAVTKKTLLLSKAAGLR